MKVSSTLEGRKRTVVMLVTIWRRTGGLESLTMDIAAAFAGSGWRVVVVSVFGHGVEEAIPGVEVVQPAPRWRLPRSLWSRGLWRRPVATLVTELVCPGDLVVFGHVNLLRALDFMKPVAGVSRLAWLYGLEVWGREAGKWAPYLNGLDRAVAISRYTAHAAASGGVNVPITVIPCCVDTDQFTPSTSSEDVRRHEILICGRMSSAERYKGHELLFRCLPLVERRLRVPVTLRVIGAGDDLGRLKARAAELGVAEAVTFTGRVPLAELVDAYRRCGVFCMPSVVDRHDVGFWTGEGFGIVYIEAQACGRPVVASTDGGAPETIVPGETGLLADPRDPESVADAIASILGDAAASDQMGRRGREFVCRTFSTNAFMERVRDMVAEVTGSAAATCVPIA